MTAGCTKKMRIGTGYCGKPVKASGLCGLHLAAQNRADKNYLARMAKWQRYEELQAEAKRLSKILGVTVTVNFGFNRQVTGEFVVPGDWLRAIAKKAKEAS